MRFSTYASWWIKQSIVRSLSNKKRVIRLPHRQEEKLRKINKVYNNLSQVLMREPSLVEIAHEIGLEEEEVASILNSSGSVASLDATLSADSGSLHDVVEDNSFDPGNELMKKTLREDTLRFPRRPAGEGKTDPPVPLLLRQREALHAEKNRRRAGHLPRDGPPDRAARAQETQELLR